MDYPQRSRSQTRVYGDPSPRDIDYFNGPADRTHRSKSLDYRRGLDDEESYDRERWRGSQPHLARRPYDYERDLRLDFDSPRRDYFDSSRGTFGRNRELTRSQEWYPSGQNSRWQPPSPNQLRQKWYPPAVSQGRGEYAQNRQPGLSPKSVSSGKRLNVSTSSKRDTPRLFNFGRRKEEQSPRSGIFHTQRDEYRGEPRYRYDGQGMEMGTVAGGGGGGGGYSRQHHSSYHHSSHSAGQGGASTVGRKPIIHAQPIQTGPPGPGGPYKGPLPPRQHYRVQCCCFTFTWPPWSYEPAPPPQQIYRNI